MRGVSAVQREDVEHRSVCEGKKLAQFSTMLENRWEF